MDKSKSTQSMINNLKSVRGDAYGAAEAKFVLARVKQYTGQSEQSLLCRMVLYAFGSSPEFDAVRPAILGEWTRVSAGRKPEKE